jgi:hypothetical protein
MSFHGIGRAVNSVYYLLEGARIIAVAADASVSYIVPATQADSYQYQAPRRQLGDVLLSTLDNLFDAGIMVTHRASNDGQEWRCGVELLWFLGSSQSCG